MVESSKSWIIQVEPLRKLYGWIEDRCCIQYCIPISKFVLATIVLYKDKNQLCVPPSIAKISAVIFFFFYIHYLFFQYNIYSSSRLFHMCISVCLSNSITGCLWQWLIVLCPQLKMSLHLFDFHFFLPGRSYTDFFKISDS